jgi:hypothetical protein
VQSRRGIPQITPASAPVKVVPASAPRIYFAAEIHRRQVAPVQLGTILNAGIEYGIGLQLLAASQAYDRLLRLRGKVRFSRTLDELKEDR